MVATAVAPQHYDFNSVICSDAKTECLGVVYTVRTCNKHLKEALTIASSLQK